MQKAFAGRIKTVQRVACGLHASVWTTLC